MASECSREDRILFSFGGAQRALGRGIITHPSLNLIFATDTGNASIQVFTLCGDHVTTHTPQLRRFCPWGVAYRQQTIYLTDVRSNRLLSLNDFAVLVVREFSCFPVSKLKSPKGLACDRDSNVYVADRDNNRICLFDYELNFLGIFRHQLLHCPRDVTVIEDQLLVLTEFNPFMLVFSLSGEMLQLIDKLTRWVLSPWFFYVDDSWNIFISDYDSFSIKLFSKEGELREELISFKIEQSGRRISVFGICVTADKQICIATADKTRPFLLLSN